MVNFKIILFNNSMTISTLSALTFFHQNKLYPGTLHQSPLNFSGPAVSYLGTKACMDYGRHHPLHHA